jgi:hypothetical protein
MVVFNPFRYYVGLSPPRVLRIWYMIWSQAEAGKQRQYIIQAFICAVVWTKYSL